jgi:hypothetical protein
VPSSRFIVLSVMVAGESDDDGHESISWLLVSSNNRPLGKAAASYPTSEACREDVHRLRQQYGRVRSIASLTEGREAGRTGGQWTWRAELDGEAIAVATRTYLRHRECEYSRQRFLEAVPASELAATVRSIRSGRR